MKNGAVQIGLVGCGTVGRGTLEVFRRNLPLLEKKAGARLRFAWVASRRAKALPALPGGRPRFTRDWRRVVADPAVDVVVELVGGYEPARAMVLGALRAGKHVATANKALLAKYWGEVFETAARHRALVYFEAAVASGVPVVQGLNEGLAANRVESVSGILNGTTNYILTRMVQEGLDFASALKGAQEAGFAEADPSFDIDGKDAAHKIAILASLAAGGWVRLEHVHCEGIRGLDVWDVRFAAEKLGLVLKLLGLARLEGNRHSVRVHPAFLRRDHPFADVHREYNAVVVQGDAAGDVMFYGKGAGATAAASAVLSDVVYIARQVANGTAGQIPYVAYDPGRRLTPIPFNELVSRHYLRFTTQDKPGVLARITGTLGRRRLSIASVHQDAPAPGQRGVPVVVVTHPAPEGAVQAALRDADRLPAVLEKAVHIRIEDFR